MYFPLAIGVALVGSALAWHPISNSTSVALPASTETLTTFTTTTVCPITTTKHHGSSAAVITTWTTSTITVTSCVAGCHGNHPHPSTSSQSLPVSTSSGEQPPKTHTKSTPAGTSLHTSSVLGTSAPSTPTTKSQPPHTWPPVTKETTTTFTYTTTITNWVPCSTPVAISSGHTYYSTYLTPTYVTTCYTGTTTLHPTSTPAGTSPKVTGSPAPSTTSTCLPPSTSTGIATGKCPAAETVYSTIIYTVYIGNECKTQSGSIPEKSTAVSTKAATTVTQTKQTPTYQPSGKPHSQYNDTARFI